MTILDGGMGTLLQAAGLPAGRDPADWNIENPEAVTAVHRAYRAAGSDIVLTNTFGANRLKYHGRHGLGEVIRAAIAVAKSSGPGRVALDIGPTGRLLKPAGDLDFEAAVEAFAEVVRLATIDVQPSTFNVQPDLVFIETMGDTRELKAAVLAAKENCALPVYATVALGEDGKLLTGASVECVAELLEGLGVDAYGFNCGLGPDRMLPFVERLARISSKPIIVKPNAGMPRLVDGRTVFDVDPVHFAEHVRRLVDAGASIVGGCCGTTPEHIGSARGAVEQFNSLTVKQFNSCTGVTSGVERVELKSGEGTIIGERINPTGKKKLKEAYQRGDEAYILREAVMQCDAGAKILDINCGVPGIDEKATLVRTLAAVESVVTCPVEIDTSDPAALEAALRIVNGRALVNSVNGKRESMDAVFPLVRKYGGVIVALCLDESGIPDTVEGRLAIARKILDEGAKCGFSEKDFVFDALTLSVSTDPQAAVRTLETVKKLTGELKVNTVLGVSNVSFGLPNRPALNNAMYALAKRAGLSAAIANPAVIRDEIAAGAEDVLLGRDPGCAKWIEANTAREGQQADYSKKGQQADNGGKEPQAGAESLYVAVVHGLKADAATSAAEWLKSAEPLEVIEKGIVPALEEVGKGFEKGSVFLPQLLMAADAAGEAFAVVRKRLGGKGCRAVGSEGAEEQQADYSKKEQQADYSKGAPIVLATVKGDIHDIGKNIVRALLENYGYDVIDLGRDVAPERIVEAAVKNHAKLVGLSALMTTTVGAMAETIRQLKASGCGAKTVVGGAVVTQEYADSIGADFYAKDAMRTVRIAGEVMSSR